MKYSNKLLFICFGLVLLAASSYAHGSYKDHVCVHDKLDIQPVPGMHHEDPTGRNRVLADWAPFRIATDFSNFDTLPSNINTSNATVDAFKAYAKNVLVPAAVRWMAHTYQVKQYSSGLKAPEGMLKCGDNNTLVHFPEEILHSSSKQGPEADLMVLVSLQNDTEGSWAAQAYACASDSVTRRNYIGAIQFNLAYMKPVESDWTGNLGVSLHELTHLLFMTGTTYPRFYDPTTSDTRVQNLVEKRMIDGINTTVFTHPRLVEEARSYFGCPTIDHVKIENQGGSGSLGSHWERNWFGNEFVTASTSKRMPVSRMTLILAEVSGWYKSNFDVVEALVWGRKKGCDFLTKPCLSGREHNITAPLTPSASEFCGSKEARGCNYEWSADSYCNIDASKTGVSPVWDYFRDNSSTGSDQFGDNCPTYSGYSNRICTHADAQAQGFSPESFGAGSACFVSSFHKTSQTLGSAFGQCYNYECTPKADGNYTLDVLLGDHVSISKVTCESMNQQISVPASLSKTYVGTMTCPDPTAFCQLKAGLCPRGCGGAGVCKNGVCQCNNGRIGPDCLRDAPAPVTKATAYLRRI